MKVIPFTGEHVPGAQILQETEVTVERRRGILETAVIDLEPDDEGDLYLTGGVDFPIWVRVDHDRKTVELFRFIRRVAKDEATVTIRLNELNSKFPLGQFHHLDDAIYSRHAVSFDGGLLSRQLVKTVLHFSASCRDATGDMTDHLAQES